MFHGIDHIVYYVTNVERTIDWYHEIFGLEAEGLEAWRAGQRSFVSLRVSPTMIIDLLPGTPAAGSVDHIAYSISAQGFDNFVAEHSDLIEMGPAELSGAQGLGEGLYLRDLDQHRIELRTYR